MSGNSRYEKGDEAYMLPNINANNRDVGLKGSNEQPYSKHGGSSSLRRGSWLGVVTISNFFKEGLYPYQTRECANYVYSDQCEVLTSQPQPLPWTAAVFSFIAFLNASTEPKSLSMASFKAPVGWLVGPVGARFFQKSEWLMCPDDTLIRVITRDKNHNTHLLRWTSKQLATGFAASRPEIERTSPLQRSSRSHMSDGVSGDEDA